MGRILMCGSFKGGVGKSVTTYNLTYSLAEILKRVLCVDFILSSMVLSAVDSKLRLEMGAEGMLSRILEPLIKYAPGNGACEAYRMLAKVMGRALSSISTNTAIHIISTGVGTASDRR